MDAVAQEIRKEKQKRIEETEKKLNDYRTAYNSINEGTVTKFTKNSMIGLFKVIIYFLAIIFLFASVVVLFDDSIMNEPTTQGEAFFSNLIFAILFIAIGKALKSNIEKRNVISKLSKLMEDVIAHMDGSLKNEKERYEHFIDENMSK
ncbi:MAG: hypothetical protein AB7V07_09205 [Candidatus Delongbacteria bacterium]